jgi:hypothetical protein
VGTVNGAYMRISYAVKFLGGLKHMGSLVRCNICGLYTIHEELLQGAHPRCRKEEAAKMAAFELELKHERKQAKAAARQVKTLRLIPTPLNLTGRRRRRALSAGRVRRRAKRSTILRPEGKRCTCTAL